MGRSPRVLLSALAASVLVGACSPPTEPRVPKPDDDPKQEPPKRNEYHGAASLAQSWYLDLG